MLLMDGGSHRKTLGALSYSSIETPIRTTAKFSVITYKVTIIGDDIEPYEQTGIPLIDGEQYDFVVKKSYPVPFAAQGNYFGIWNGNSYSPLFIKGVNLGVSVPGTHPGELAATRECTLLSSRTKDCVSTNKIFSARYGKII